MKSYKLSFLVAIFTLSAGGLAIASASLSPNRTKECPTLKEEFRKLLHEQIIKPSGAEGYDLGRISGQAEVVSNAFEDLCNLRDESKK